jgi:hypothetical protein
MNDKTPVMRQENSKKGSDDITHREDIAEKGDYLGRKPGVVTEVTPFDEEALVDERENGAEPGGETKQAE